MREGDSQIVDDTIIICGYDARCAFAVNATILSNHYLACDHEVYSYIQQRNEHSYWYSF